MSITRSALLRGPKEKLADIILALVEKSPDAGEYVKVILARRDPDPTWSISKIKKKVESFKNSTRYVSKGCSFNLRNQIKQVRNQIMKDVLPNSPNEAVTLLRSLIELPDHGLVEQMDDSYGVVAEALSEACEDLAKAYEQATYPLNDAVDFVYNCLLNDDYGIYHNIMPYFETALGKIGLQALQQKFQSTERINSSQEYTVKESLKQIPRLLKNIDD